MTMLKRDITTPLRQAMFLSQLAHESGNFRFVVENLNYSAEALCRTWPARFAKVDANGERIVDKDGKHIPNALAVRIQRQPELIANRVYANRMGNGDEASGDGWKYRGRGLIQLTGKDNYTAFARDNNNNALQKPDDVAEAEMAVESAGWFWATNRLNQIADTGDVKAVTRRINGGFNGLADREAKYNKLMQILG